MSVEIDRAGNFRGVITECGLYEAKSGAKAVNITASIRECWNSETKQWEDWEQYEIVAHGAIWIIKTDGTVNTKGVQSAVECANWNGSFEKAAVGVFADVEKPCQFVVNEEGPNEFHKETQYKIAFLNDFDRTPGGNGNVSPERAKELQTQYGAQFRALGGNVQRNTAKPIGKLKPPAPKSKPTIPLDENMNAELASQAPVDDGVPF
jgi:hypothetical protein